MIFYFCNDQRLLKIVKLERGVLRFVVGCKSDSLSIGRLKSGVRIFVEVNILDRVGFVVVASDDCLTFERILEIL